MFSSIPKRLALLLMLVSLVFGVSLFVIADQVLLSGFRLSETRLLSLDIDRVNRMFFERQRLLEDKAIDNGARDSSYFFTRGIKEEGYFNQAYINEVFSPLNFLAAQVDLICMLDFEGNILYGGISKGHGVVSVFNREIQQKSNEAKAYQEAFQETVKQLRPVTAFGARGGILTVDGKNYLIGVGHIQKSSKDDAEPIGLFVMGIELTRQVFDDFRSQIKVNFLFSEWNLKDSKQNRVAKILQEGRNLYIDVLEGNMIQGHYLIHDITGQHHFIITITKPYNFLTSAEYAVYLFIGWFAIFCVILFILMMTFSRQYIFKRLQVMTKLSNGFWKNDNTLLPVLRNDEVSQLTESINNVMMVNRLLINNGFQIVLIVDQDNTIVNANMLAHQLLGWSYPRLIGASLSRVFDQMPDFSVAESTHSVFETAIRAKYEESFPVEVYSAAFTIRYQQFRLIMLNNLSDRKRVEASFSKKTYYDSQTMLPNRQMFLIRLEENLKQWRQDSSVSFAVALLDIDRFRIINDISIQSADYVMNKVVMRIQNVINEYNGLGRLSRMTGDEFAFIIPGDPSREKLTHLASRIRKVASIPVVIDGKTVFPNVCLGILAKAQQHLNLSDILTRINFTLEQAKEKGIGGFALYQGDHDDSLTGHQDVQTVEFEIREALARDEIFSFFQPIWNLEKEELVGFEALIRWISPNTRGRSPEYFITLAEESGAITALDRRVIRQGIEALAVWNLVMPELYICVNVSIRDLIEPGFIDYITNTITELKATPQNLVLEFTENLLIMEADALNLALEQLQSFGIRIGLDDFGRRYSSLEYINQLPLSYLKVGHTFVSKIRESALHDRMVEAIIGLSKSLEIGFIAEGIETREQLDWLQKKGCQLGQGFYFSPAVPRVEANKLVKIHSRTRRTD